MALGKPQALGDALPLLTERLLEAGGRPSGWEDLVARFVFPELAPHSFIFCFL